MYAYRSWLEMICRIISIPALILTVRACMPVGVSNEIHLGFDTYVCLTIAPLKWTTNGTYSRVFSTFKSDNMSSINVKGSWTSAKYKNDTAMKKFKISDSYGHGLGVSIESMGVMSYQRAYRIVNQRSTVSTFPNGSTHTKISKRPVTFPLMMAIINVDHGSVTSINWDQESCRWCASEYCDVNYYDYFGNVVTGDVGSCFVDDDECSATTTSTTTTAAAIINNSTTSNALCELNVYVTWTGTDTRGFYFKSAAARFSRLSTAQLKQFTSARKTTSG